MNLKVVVEIYYIFSEISKNSNTGNFSLTLSMLTEFGTKPIFATCLHMDVFIGRQKQLVSLPETGLINSSASTIYCHISIIIQLQDS